MHKVQFYTTATPHENTVTKLGSITSDMFRDNTEQALNVHGESFAVLL